MSKEIIDRNKYLTKLIPFIDKRIIKVIIGQRRVGKSYFLKSLIRYISKNDKHANIVYIDKELMDFDFINDAESLIEYTVEMFNPQKKNYLMIDEIQDIVSFERALRHLQNKQEFDVYCTGSNANLLSKDIANHLSGRYIEICINSLSYPEFLTFNKFDNSNESLVKYLKWGSLPFIKNLQQEDVIVFDYLKNIVSTIIYKDVINRYKIRNVDFFDNLVLFLANNTGNVLSANKISDYLKSQKTDISPKVILSYLQYLQDAFFVYKLRRENLTGKKIFASNHKYFFEDWGLKNALLGLTHFSVPNIIENVVFSHLKYLDYEVNIGVIHDKEIDFVGHKAGEKVYVQVAYSITDDKVKQREFGNLLLIADNFPKYVVSLDDYPIGSYKGVHHLKLRDFLTKTEL